MIESINSIQDRIKSIYDRINSINAKVRNITSTILIKPSEPTYGYSMDEKNSWNSSQSTKTFQEVLQEVILESKDTDGNEINILDKPDISVENIVNSSVKNINSEQLESIIEEASSKYKLPKELIKAVIKAESNFDPTAVSPKNAMGLMQIIPQTAKELGISNPFDIYENVMGGAKYLRQMLDKFNQNLFLALAAYNAGPKRVETSNTIPDIKETKEYVDRVIKFYKEYTQVK